MVEDALASDKLVFCNLSDHKAAFGITDITSKLDEILQRNIGNTIRICIPTLGSLAWDDIGHQEILLLIHALRGLLRRYPQACASLGLPPHLSDDKLAGVGWTQKIGWLSDACISFEAFTADPSLAAVFPTYHGLVQVLSLPAPHTLQPPSDRFSTLRGLSAAGGIGGGSGENNLAFKCMRKRFVVETLHLDVEGGVGERRTAPAPSVHGAAETAPLRLPADTAGIAVGIEEPAISSSTTVPDASISPAAAASSEGKTAKRKKVRKTVAFASGDRPELDF